VLRAIVLLCLAACAIPKSEVPRAKAARYDVDRAIVIAAIASAFAERCPGARLRPFQGDPDLLMSDWWWIDKNQPISPYRLFSRDPPVGHFFRWQFYVSRAPPFAVSVWAEVDRYDAGWMMPRTYTPGHAEKVMRRRPMWVDDRIDEMAVLVYRRLRPYLLRP
jgi:hypothetical protein